MRQFLENVTGLSIYPMISLVLFVLAFSIAIYITFAIRKDSITKLKNMPLELEDNHDKTTK